MLDFWRTKNDIVAHYSDALMSPCQITSPVLHIRVYPGPGTLGYLKQQTKVSSLIPFLK